MSLIRFLGLKRLCNFGITTKIFRTYSNKPIDLSDPTITKYFSYLMIEHENLLAKGGRTAEENRRLYQIKPVVGVLEQRIALYDNIESLKELRKRDDQDPEVKKMIKEEAEIYLKRLLEIDQELQSILVDPNLTEGGVLMEITAGAGGQEAMLFAGELLDMYEAYAEYRDWSLNIASIEKSDIGGVRKVSMLIDGVGVPEMMRMEAGVHRVQRVPTTEKGGRIHTSTVSVAVLPQPTDIDLDLPDRDLTIETKRASGAGGQHVNTTDSAVRIVHIPTGTAVECQEGRSQIKNKEIALQKLKSLLLQKQIEEQEAKSKTERKSQVGSGNRNEKIRTYNYPQDRVTDHRNGGGQYTLKTILEGAEQLGKLQEGLLCQQTYDALIEEIEDFRRKVKEAVEATKT